MGDVVPLDPDEDRATREYQQEMAVKRVEGALRASGVPQKWRTVAWADLDESEGLARREAIGAVRRWAQLPRWPPDPLIGFSQTRGVLLSGPVGIGKTRLAATAALDALTRGPVRWMPLAEVFRHLSFGFGSPERERALKRLDAREGTAVILDDLDKARPSEYAAEAVYSAINGWVEAETPLLVTMNANLEELSERFPSSYGEAIASRLAEHCDVFEIEGRDRRVNP